MYKSTTEILHPQISPPKPLSELKLPKAGLFYLAASLPHLCPVGSHRTPSCVCTAAGLSLVFTQDKLLLKPLKIGCRAGLCACLFSSQAGFCSETPKATPVQGSHPCSILHYLSLMNSTVKIIPPCPCS